MIRRRLLCILCLLALLTQPSAAFVWVRVFLTMLAGGGSDDSSASNNENNAVKAQQSIAQLEEANSIFLNCGSSTEVTDSKGQTWRNDQYFRNGGTMHTEWLAWLYSDGSIFRSYRTSSKPVRYEIPIASADFDEYTVTLHFNERFDLWKFLVGWLFGTELSKMDVFVQETKVFDQLEIAGTVSVETTASTASTGSLVIEIQSSNADPSISAIQIVPLAANTVGAPTDAPNNSPTDAPSNSPTVTLTDAPATSRSTTTPTTSPTLAPTTDPTQVPTSSPSAMPVGAPIAAPTSTRSPTLASTTNPSASQIQAPTAAPSASPAPKPELVTDSVRINCGGSKLTDTKGNDWLADVFYTDGGKYQDARFFIEGSPVGDEILFQTERNALAYFEVLDYRIPVANDGFYKVVLYNAELYFNEAGRRVFSVALEGDIVEEALDLFAAAGGIYKALIRTYFVEVTDGMLNIEFESISDRAKIGAIEVIYEGVTRRPTQAPTEPPTKNPTTSPQIFGEREPGLVIMEAESVDVTEPWIYETTLPAYTGTGYYNFQGNNPAGGDPLGYMSYFFRVREAGIYTMMLRSYKANDDNTLSNDCFTRLAGYPSFLDNSIKTYMAGDPYQWSYNTELDWHEEKMIPRYDLVADTVYEFQLAGRSKDFYVDRIVLFKESVVSRAYASDPTLPESPLFDPTAGPVVDANGAGWVEVDTADADLIARHEACFVFDDNTRKAYLLGGRYRGDNSVNIYDPEARMWTKGKAPPIELHHMQCVVLDAKIWMVSSWTGDYPFESNTADIHIYDPVANDWSTKPGLPEERRRGGAATVVVGRRIYVSHGNRGGHETGDHATSLGWLDYYDVDTEMWVTNLPDAPNPRDHTGGALVNGRVCVAGGRNGGAIDFTTKMILPTDCFDLDSGTWTVEANIPVGRAGSLYGTDCSGNLLVAGGEGNGQAYNRFDVFDGLAWTKLDDLNIARHGSGLAVDCQCNVIHIASGSGAQGGGPELKSVETYFPGGEDAVCDP